MTDIKKFSDYGQLTSDLAFNLIDMINDLDKDNVDAEFGMSNQSCSAYVNISITFIDEDGDEDENSVKIRFSDHADRYGSDITFDILNSINVIMDDGEYVETQIEAWAYDEMLKEAFDFAVEKIAA